MPVSETYVLRLIPPRSDFALTMSAEEQAVMNEHVAYWSPHLEAGSVKVFGPVMEPDSTWGLAVFEADDAEAARERAENDPSVLSGVNTFALGSMPTAPAV